MRYFESEAVSLRAPIARHRAESQRSSLTTIARAVSSNAGGVGRSAAVVAAASGLVLSAGVPAQAAVDRDANTVTAVTGLISANALSVPAEAKVTFERAAISSAPAVTDSEAALQSNLLAEQKAEAKAADAAEAEAAAQEQAVESRSTSEAAPSSTVSEAAPAAEESAQSAGDVAAGIASAAYAQLGVNQDCTMLVTNALSAVGINHHGWPDSYLSLGTTISAGQAQPGDLVYYADGGTGRAHIAVYVGNGQAVHGGWSGTTALASVNVGSGPVFIRVNG